LANEGRRRVSGPRGFADEKRGGACHRRRVGPTERLIADKRRGDSDMKAALAIEREALRTIQDTRRTGNDAAPAANDALTANQEARRTKNDAWTANNDPRRRKKDSRFERNEGFATELAPFTRPIEKLHVRRASFSKDRSTRRQVSGQVHETRDPRPTQPAPEWRSAGNDATQSVRPRTITLACR
jgi:hypothetical protein